MVEDLAPQIKSLDIRNLDIRNLGNFFVYGPVRIISWPTVILIDMNMSPL